MGPRRESGIAGILAHRENHAPAKATGLRLVVGNTGNVEPE